ncbi:MAG: M23 family metallopeptidase [Firmicutes bacterium]|nr:M23 family metallopeptidase [Bacillota bacterium]
MKKLLLLPVLVTTLVLTSAFIPQNYEIGKERNSNFSENIQSVIEIESSMVSTEEKMEEKKPEEKKFIKWIEFNPSYQILGRVQKAHVKLVSKGITDIGSCEILAYLALKNSNRFNIKADTKNLSKLMKELESGNRESIDKYEDNKYFKYYVESYHAVLDGIIDAKSGTIIGFHPIAKGFWHTGYSDFGNSRTYGFKRRHLGHDLYGGVGTPIISMESGTITELGWNRYGGWRVGIRSEDTKRYYYYAHLRKDHPYPAHLKIGDKVEAGQVIGYLGQTGYSSKENVNMKTKAHLHFGMQIIFDKSQEDGNGEIWIDVYNICKFLSANKAKVVKDTETKEYSRVI